MSYLWDFGDGPGSSDPLVVHEHPAGGVYDVTRTVTDQDGLTDSVTKTVSITLSSDGFESGDTSAWSSSIP